MLVATVFVREQLPRGTVEKDERWGSGPEKGVLTKCTEAEFHPASAIIKLMLTPLKKLNIAAIKSLLFLSY